MNFERQNVQAMSGYVSGEQPDQADVIKLNTNENPYPASPTVATALAAIKVESLRRYPPPTALPLRLALAKLHGIEADNIIITNGGDELLRLLLATFVEASETIGTAAPSYSLYDVLADAHGCKLKKFPLQQDWLLNPDLADQLNQENIKLCFVVNPNAPSGVLNAVAQIENLLGRYKGLLVLDEAYVNFVDPEQQYDCVALVRKYPNLIILRTFSKGYSLAGLRMAYGIGSATLINPMQYKTKDSYNTDLIAQTLALAAIADQAYASNTWQLVRQERAMLTNALLAMGISCPPSQSNFLLAQIPAPLNAEQVYLGLKKAGILVRYFKVDGLADRLRITVGTPEENRKLLIALQPLLG